MKMEIMVADADGKQRAARSPNFGCASFAPTFTPDGKKILFSSNKQECDSRKFELYLMNVDGSGLEQVTNFGGFTSFPEFSPDGKTLVFCSDGMPRSATSSISLPRSGRSKRGQAAGEISISFARLLGSGTGSPNSRRICRRPSIASRIFRSVASKVSPVVTSRAGPEHRRTSYSQLARRLPRISASSMFLQPCRRVAQRTREISATAHRYRLHPDPTRERPQLRRKRARNFGRVNTCL